MKLHIIGIFVDKCSQGWEGKHRIPSLFRGLAGMVLCMMLAACAGTGGDRARHAAPATISLDPAQRTEVVMTALGLLDAQYRYGGAVRTTGFDCSGLVAYVFAAAAKQSLPHNTAMIAELSRPISRNRLQSGDFVFFNTLGSPNSHMGIYLGDGRFVNAPSSGGRVRIDSLHSPYYRDRFESARTLFKS
ncbi:C40 family peptidase [Pollutimonas thiosulfatoxidans]|uniref:NlpC/P60 domain-containing protein n=1 Tax=Pollutimonas thiosulfatoxidans TaxID=2028345 RepID=A0A410G9B9_9BURK|nr:C40 family peptidase [Pollutimonas thiosulfatoxidans]QAA92909.1 hypothetical protein CKA81_02915 [Pollutimonas thiosulfatoxidans]